MAKPPPVPEVESKRARGTLDSATSVTLCEGRWGSAENVGIKPSLARRTVPITTFARKNLRDFGDLPPYDYAYISAQKHELKSPFIITVPPKEVTIRGSFKRLLQPVETSAHSYLIWAEDGEIKGWMLPSKIPKGAARTENLRWWVWSDGRQLQIAERYPENYRKVADSLAQQSSWERLMGIQRTPDPQDVRRRVEAGSELNRDIERYMAGGSMDAITRKLLPPLSLEESRRRAFHDHQEVLEVLVVGAFLVFSSPIEPFSPAPRSAIARPSGVRRMAMPAEPLTLSENGLRQPEPHSAGAKTPSSLPEYSFGDVEVPADFDFEKVRGSEHDFRVPKAMPEGASSSVPIRESKGATAGKGPIFQSASAKTARAQVTAIKADIGEAEIYKAALGKGEIGLQRPLGANAGGPDMITAVIGPKGPRIVVTDAATSTTGKFNKGQPILKAKWRLEVVEAEIRDAVRRGDIDVRVGKIDYSKGDVARAARITGL